MTGPKKSAKFQSVIEVESLQGSDLHLAYFGYYQWQARALNSI